MTVESVTHINDLDVNNLRAATASPRAMITSATSRRPSRTRSLTWTRRSRYLQVT